MTFGRRSAGALALLVVLLYITAFCLVMRDGSYNAWAPLLIGPALFVATVPIAVREARRRSDDGLAGLLLAAVALKMLAAVVRYIVTFDVYSKGDANSYHSAGVALAASYRHGSFHGPGGELTGTRFVEVVTGVVYTVIGPTKLGGFLVFAWLGYLGLLFLYRAFTTAVPDGDHRRYALLLFFLPSLLFWPASIGKDSWMVFGIGITALGAARLYVQRPGGYLLTGLGMAAVGAVRPHIALLILVPLFAGFVFRRSRREQVLLRTGSKVAGVLVLLVAGTVVAGNAERYLGVDSFSADSVNEVLANNQERTGQGGGTFTAPNSRSLTGFPVAVVTVLFRPFPTEARGIGSAMASAEGVFLLGLIAVSLGRLRPVPRALFRHPYLLLCLIYSLLFIFVFSSFGNFGILARERVQVFPFVLALLSLRRRESAPLAAAPAVIDIDTRRRVAIPAP